MKKLAQWTVAAMLAYGQVAGAAQDTILVGFHAGLTGPAAADGLGARKAVELAFEEQNRQGGIDGRRLELLSYDDEGKAEQGVAVAHKLSAANVVAVISAGFAPPSKSAAQVFQAESVPYVNAVAANPDITRAGDHVFRISSIGEVEGRAAAKFAAETLKPKRVVLLTVKADMGKVFSTGFKYGAEQFGLNIVGEYEYSVGERQFGPLVGSIKNAAPDLIYATGFYFTGGPLLRQLRAGGVDATFLGPQAFSSPRLFKIAGDAAEGALITNFTDWGTTDPALRTSLDAIEKSTGIQPEAVELLAYSGAQVLIEALKKSGASGKPGREALRKALTETDQETVVGRIRFNTLHEVPRAFYISEAKAGRWVAQGGKVDDAALLAPPER